MKKIDLLSVKVRHEKPRVVVSIFLSVIIFSNPFSGLLYPARDLKESVKSCQVDSREFHSSFNLFPENNAPEDTTLTSEMLEILADTTADILSKHKNLNIVIW
jgi:hypothetical protein